MEETKCHPKWLLKDHKAAAALNKQLKEQNLTDKTGNHIAAWKIIHSLWSGKSARMVMITPCPHPQEREQTILEWRDDFSLPLSNNSCLVLLEKPPPLMRI